MPELQKEKHDSRVEVGPSASFKPLLRNIAVVVLALGYLGFRSFPALKQHFLENSSAYALCSPTGTARIYTVDADNSVAECAYVKGERFADIGSLCKRVYA